MGSCFLFLFSGATDRIQGLHLLGKCSTIKLNPQPFGETEAFPFQFKGRFCASELKQVCARV